MTSKTLFFNLIKEDLKRRLWASSLTLLTFFFALPVGAAMVLGSYDEPLKLTDAADQIHSLMAPTNGFFVFLMVVLSLMFAVSGFSYLHSRKKVDFYHSIPVKREKLFAIYYLDGILIPAAAYLIGVAAALIIVTGNGLGSGILMKTAFQAYGFFMLHYICLYSVAVLAMVLTGNLVVGILGTVVLNALVPSTLAIVTGYYASFYVNSYGGGITVLTDWAVRFSPFALFIKNSGMLQNGDGIFEKGLIVQFIIVLVMAAVLTGLALILYKKRGSEAAGKAMAFSISQPVIRIPIVILSAMAGGLFFWLFNEKTGWAVFGLVCGLVLSHCVIQIIYHFDFRKMFAGWKSLVICGAAAMAVLLVFRFDVTGYDTYVPDRDQLAYAGLSSNYVDGWVDYGQAVQRSDKVYMWDYEQRDEYVFDRMRLQPGEELMSLINLAVQKSVRDSERVYSTNIDQEDYLDFSVCYTMKSGKKIYRSYSFYSDEAYSLQKAVCGSLEYRDGTYPVLAMKAGDAASVLITVRQGFDAGAVQDAARIEQLLSAYQEEFRNLDMTAMEQEMPIAGIQFMSEIQDRAIKEDTSSKQYRSGPYWNMKEYGRYPIYPSFRKTLAILNEAGIDPYESMKKQTVESLELDMGEFITVPKYDEDGYIIPVAKENMTVVDRQQVSDMTAKAVSADYAYMNSFFDQDGYVTMRAVVNSDYNTTRYMIKKTDIPQAVMDRINTRLEEALP